MIANRLRVERAGGGPRRGAAAVELAVCLPLLVTLLLGMLEVGRMVEVQQVTCNSVREGARDASLGSANLLALGANLQLYLQSAEPGAFGAGHSTSFITSVVTLPANTYGYTCWDNTANRELFTFMFADVTKPTVTDPSGMSQLDVYSVSVSYPFASVSWLPATQVLGQSRFTATVYWVSMVDSPFQLSTGLQAQ
jgi:Flp pilus assembly protein TadG